MGIIMEVNSVILKFPFSVSYPSVWSEIAYTATLNRSSINCTSHLCIRDFSAYEEPHNDVENSVSDQENH